MIVINTFRPLTVNFVMMSKNYLFMSDDDRRRHGLKRSRKKMSRKVQKVPGKMTKKYSGVDKKQYRFQVNL